VSCEWIDGRRGLGARFDGTNRSGEREWTTSCVVTTYESGRRFAYDVVRPTRLSRWTYTVEPTSDGCRVTETWDDLRTPLVRRLSARRSGISDRATHNERTMAATLDRLAAAAETAAVDL
jgi:hypothetical protein